jgi:hypothetical protein
MLASLDFCRTCALGSKNHKKKKKNEAHNGPPNPFILGFFWVSRISQLAEPGKFEGGLDELGVHNNDVVELHTFATIPKLFLFSFFSFSFSSSSSLYYMSSHLPPARPWWRKKNTKKELLAFVTTYGDRKQKKQGRGREYSTPSSVLAYYKCHHPLPMKTMTRGPMSLLMLKLLR